MQLPPRFGFGTWQAPDDLVESAVKAALRTGYRHIDCAYVYGNEQAVGRGIHEVLTDAGAGIKRSDIWVTSKLWNYNHLPTRVREQCVQTIKDLQVGYLDLFLIHWPLAFKYTSDDEYFPRDSSGQMILESVSLQETWRAMEALVDEGLVKHIGVSNYCVGLLNDLLSYARVKPLVNQVEVHPWNPNDVLINYCHRQGIAVTAYSPMGGFYEGKNCAATDPVIGALAKAKGVSPQAVILAWHLAKWDTDLFSIIPKSSHEDRVRQNWQAQHLKLTPEEIDTISQISKTSGHRFCDSAIFWQIPVFN